MADYREVMHMSFWEGLKREHPELNLGQPSKREYQVVPPVLNKGAQIAMGMNRKPEESIRVDVTLTNTPEEWFNRLRAESKTIQAEVAISDGAWEWEPREDKPEAHIILRKYVRLDGPRREQYEWLVAAVVRFHQVFGRRISSFN
jgi:hypothetical protein